MARKKKPAEHVNHERWMISYADFITLLFAFFVVLFAISQVDQRKLGRFTESFDQALKWNVLPGEGRGVMPGSEELGRGGPYEETSTGTKADVSKFDQKSSGGDLKEQLREAISKKLGSGADLSGIRLEEIRGELVLRLPDHLLFDSGKALLHPQGARVLDAISAITKPHSVLLRIEGHTDNVPIQTLQYPSNWELSTGRATACVEWLVEHDAFAPNRLSAAGYGEYHPIAPNTDAEGRARNRRVDVVITKDFAEQNGPPKESTP